MEKMENYGKHGNTENTEIYGKHRKLWKTQKLLKTTENMKQKKEFSIYSEQVFWVFHSFLGFP